MPSKSLLPPLTLLHLPLRLPFLKRCWLSDWITKCCSYVGCSHSKTQSSVSQGIFYQRTNCPNHHDYTHFMSEYHDFVDRLSSDEWVLNETYYFTPCKSELEGEAEEIAEHVAKESSTEEWKIEARESNLGFAGNNPYADGMANTVQNVSISGNANAGTIVRKKLRLQLSKARKRHMNIQRRQYHVNWRNESWWCNRWGEEMQAGISCAGRVTTELCLGKAVRCRIVVLM